MSIDKTHIPAKFLFAFLLLMLAWPCAKAQTSAAQGTSSRPPSPMPHLTLQLLLPGQEITKKAADGLAVYFSNGFSNEIGNEDSYKLTNPDENIGILRTGKLLCIEGRKPVIVTDTVQLKMWNLYQKQYTLQIDLASFSGKVRGYLQDAYLHLTIPLENDAETMVPFSINADTASAAPNRFTILFTSYSNLTLPVELTDIKAYEKNKGVEVTWKAENESNIDRYEVEQSVNALTFVTVGSVSAKNNPGTTASYSWSAINEMSGTRYYRIKTYERSGEIKYSPVVKVVATNGTRNISVATNPGQKNAINVLFKNSDKGKYLVNLVSYSGQNVYTGNISHPGGSASQTITINRYLSSGMYQMVVMHDDKRENFPLLIQ